MYASTVEYELLSETTDCVVKVKNSYIEWNCLAKGNNSDIE